MSPLQSEMVPLTYQSATSVFERQPGCGSQVYQEVEDKQQHIDPVGRALPHLAATQQTTGEAMFIDDIRPYIGTCNRFSLKNGLISYTCCCQLVLVWFIVRLHR